MPSGRRWRASVSRTSPIPPRSCGNRPTKAKTAASAGRGRAPATSHLNASRYGKPSAWGVQSLPRASSTQELWGALDRSSPELVVHAGAPDVILDLDVARLDARHAERRAGERAGRAETGREEFALDRPSLAPRAFDASAQRVPPAAHGLRM